LSAKAEFSAGGVFGERQRQFVVHVVTERPVHASGLRCPHFAFEMSGLVYRLPAHEILASLQLGQSGNISRLKPLLSTTRPSTVIGL
jgi:hypothetical protein